MKKLFSIALVIAMAVSCLAIFPSAVACEGTASITHTIEGDILTVTFAADAQMVDNPAAGMDVILDWYMEYDSAVLEYLGDETLVKEGIDLEAEGNVATFCEPLDPEDPSCTTMSQYIGFMPVLEDADKNFTVSATAQWKILAPIGSTGIGFDLVEAFVGYSSAQLWAQPQFDPYYFDYEEAAPEYEAPAPAMAQELLGCEACGVDAGVRFIATVDAAADAFGMYITANGKTYTLSSETAGFNIKDETADTITFTAVIFSDLTFEVVVFEKYGDTEVKSTVGTN